MPSLIRSFRFALPILLMVFCMTALAEEWPTVLREAQTRCEAQKSAIRDIAITRNLSTFLASGEVKTEQKVYQKGKLSRMDMTTPNPSSKGETMQTVILGDGTNGWIVTSAAGKRAMQGDQTNQLGNTMLCWDFTEQNSKITGSETFEGQDCYLVELTRDSVTHKLWMDKSNFRILQGESHFGPKAVRWTLSDFRKIAGDFEHPHKVNLYSGTKLISTMIVGSIEVNKNLPDEFFDADKVAEQLAASAPKTTPAEPTPETGSGK